MINLKIDPEFQNQIPPLTDDESTSSLKKTSSRKASCSLL